MTSGIGESQPAVGRGLLVQGKNTEVVKLLDPIEATARKVYTGGNAGRLASLLANRGNARAGLAKEPAEFAAAAADLLESHAIYTKARGPTRKDMRACIQALVDLYVAWDNAEPGKCHDAKAAEWKTILDTMQSPTSQSTSAPASRPAGVE